MFYHQTRSLFLFTIVALLFLWSSGVVDAAGLVPCGGPPPQKPCQISDVIGRDGIINRLVEFVFKVVLAPLAAGVIIYAGVKMLFNAGNSSEITKAKDLIYNTIVGFIIVLCAYLIVQLIITGLASESSASGNLLRRIFTK